METAIEKCEKGEEKRTLNGAHELLLQRIGELTEVLQHSEELKGNVLLHSLGREDVEMSNEPVANTVADKFYQIADRIGSIAFDIKSNIMSVSEVIE